MFKFLLTFLILATTCGCSQNANNVKSAISISTVESDVRAHLPIGSSKSEVITFLDQQKIPHAWLQRAESAPDGEIVFPNSHTECGVISNVRVDGFLFKTYVSIQIDFIFDNNDSNLINYSVQEIYKGI